MDGWMGVKRTMVVRYGKYGFVWLTFLLTFVQFHFFTKDGMSGCEVVKLIFFVVVPFPQY